MTAAGDYTTPVSRALAPSPAGSLNPAGSCVLFCSKVEPLHRRPGLISLMHRLIAGSGGRTGL